MLLLNDCLEIRFILVDKSTAHVAFCSFFLPAFVIVWTSLVTVPASCRCQESEHKYNRDGMRKLHFRYVSVDIISNLKLMKDSFLSFDLSSSQRTFDVHAFFTRECFDCSVLANNNCTIPFRFGSKWDSLGMCCQCLLLLEAQICRLWTNLERAGMDISLIGVPWSQNI